MCLLLVTVLLVVMEAGAQTCSKRFSLWEPNHSMCQKVSPDLEKSVIPSGAERASIVDEHNKFRAGVTPTATNMEKMYWDDELAGMVKGWLSTCVGMVHDKGAQRFSPGKYGVGQNLASGSFSNGWPSVVAAWHSEVKDFKYGDQAQMSANFIKIGHYTQVVWASSARVGCAMVQCKGKSKVYGCNYAPGGNLGSSLGTPYKSGTSCADCNGKCSNKLCDCGGKVCYNYGTLDLKTCACTCSSRSGLYLADKDCALSCNKAADNKKDTSSSNTCADLAQKSTRQQDCRSNYRYKALACPWTCDICPYADHGSLDSSAARSCQSVIGFTITFAVALSPCLLLRILGI